MNRQQVFKRKDLRNVRTVDLTDSGHNIAKFHNGPEAAAAAAAGRSKHVRAQCPQLTTGTLHLCLINLI